MDRLLLVDGNAILHRAYHALPNFTNKKGELTGAVYGFMTMLLRVIEDLKPRYVAVTFDTPKPTFRHGEYAGYQAQRPRMESDLSSQFDKVFKILEAAQIPVFSVEGYEADDVIATIARQAIQTQKSRQRRGSPQAAKIKTDEVVIVTGDRDILQLVDEAVKVYIPIKGLSEAKLFGKEEVVEKLGVSPAQIADYKGLVGDPSDNYPGVSGIGPKTAIRLLKKYRTIEEVYRNLGQIYPQTAKKLAEGAELAALSKKLATIVDEVPITLKLESCGKWNLQSAAVKDVFSSLGFKSLISRIENKAQLNLV